METSTFVEGETVVVSELVAGYATKYGYAEHHHLYEPDARWEDDLWQRNLDKHKEIKSYCESHDGFSVHGVIYGSTVRKDFPYRLFDFAAYDISRPDGSFCGFREFYSICLINDIPMVPLVYEALPFNRNRIQGFAGEASELGHRAFPRKGVAVGSFRGETGFKMLFRNPIYVKDVA